MFNRFWTLKRKLFVFSVALISIPFLSVGFLKQLEDILVENLLDNLSSYASSIAFTLNKDSFISEFQSESSLFDTTNERFFVSSIEHLSVSKLQYAKP